MNSSQRFYSNEGNKNKKKFHVPIKMYVWVYEWISKQVWILWLSLFFKDFPVGINSLKWLWQSISLESIAIMAVIKIFQLVQSFYETLGLYSPQSNQIHSFNLRMLFFSTFLISDFCSMLLFLSLEAKTVQVFSFPFFIIWFFNEFTWL